ncbi:hypothetical protein [Methylococcus geothermalis]|uniref:Uncharacterized protein n=1 Tax=Methylococcus geothermalis TaxID=2681310 RepID=A0A858Q484_9GAMM|nr:hypothetical protein [Methylococcus geothermalis]QJD28650.1 hypothetical protein GNH96_00825 [Methylococcus geothermalis]
MNDERPMNDHAATVHDIARAAREGKLTSEALGKILESRHGAVNCYPGQPTDTCHPIAYFIALEGRLGHELQLELAHAEWEADRPPRWWTRHLLRYWYLQRRYGHPPRPYPMYPMYEPPFTFAYMLGQLLQHVMFSCYGETRELVLITDTWNPEAFECWRDELEYIQHKASLAIYLIGEGSLCTRLI